MTSNQIESTFDTRTFIAGFLIGILAGGVAALFKVPQSGQQTRQQISETGDNLLNKLESAVPSDPIADGLAEGKAAARRRQSELGMG